MASPTRFSFVHAADLHLDTPFRGVEATSPVVAETLRDASLRAFDAVIELAIGRGAAFVLFAGDIYDGSERGVRSQLRFLDGLERLSRAGISSFVAYGNHDPLESGWSAITSTWPKEVTIFPATGPDVVAVEREGVRIATVQGLSYARRATEENLALHLRRPAGPGVHVGLLHCNVEGSPKTHSNYSPCTLADLRATGLDYLALGHVHERRILCGGAPGEPYVVYPGNTQARSIAELGEKGVYLVEVEGGVVGTPEFVACDNVRFFHPELDVSACSSLGEVASMVSETGSRIIDGLAGRSAICRIELVGRTSIHSELQRKGTITDLLEALRGDEPVRKPFFHIENLVDRTSPERDLDEVRARGDFTSDLLHLVDEVRDSEARADESSCPELFNELRDGAPTRFRRELDAMLSDRTWREGVLRASTLRALDALEDE